MTDVLPDLVWMEETRGFNDWLHHMTTSRVVALLQGKKLIPERTLIIGAAPTEG